ncbi:MAG TPA: sigma-70 family RNA polymerase sigma factor [Gemmatimonadales bacterium]|jgi:RNA polymerase sigma factor (TIGR02999 family)
MSNDAPLPHTVTRLFDQLRQGDAGALDELLPLLYTDLHGMAARQMAHERPDHTLQPTALVHEAFLRLTSGAPVAFTDRLHFFRVASGVMRRVLVDHARRRRTAKRGGVHVTLDEALQSPAPTAAAALDVEVLDDALTRLAAADPRSAQVVELRFFGGLDLAEVAETLDLSVATVKRDWQFARGWLAHDMDDRAWQDV